MKRSNYQRGQALVLIVLALVGMIGLTGLAVDGGNAYSDRRHAQNAADTAALAAGLARIRATASDPVDAWRNAGYNIAANNGYQQAGPNSTVNVSLCSESGVTCPLPAQVMDASGNMVAIDLSQFVKVSITSTVHTYFAPIVGIRQLTNQVDAIVRAIPSQTTKYFNGAALASTMPGCKYPGWPNDPFVAGGSATANITGSQLFVNAKCDPDFTVSLQSSTLTATEGVCLVGSADPSNTGVVGTVTDHCSGQLDVNQYSYPEVDTLCAALPKEPNLDQLNGQPLMNPGRYYSSFPGHYVQAGPLYFRRGLYCLYSGLDEHSGQWVLSTDLNNNGTNDPGSEGAMFYVHDGGVTLNGSSTARLSAVLNSGCSQNGLDGLLIYLPLSNSSTVQLNGGGDSQFTGTILAPSSLVTLSGGNSTASNPVDFETQIIGYSISIGGGGHLNIHYDPCVTADTYLQPMLQPYK